VAINPIGILQCCFSLELTFPVLIKTLVMQIVKKGDSVMKFIITRIDGRDYISLIATGQNPFLQVIKTS
jgi:hypothetical protein